MSVEQTLRDFLAIDYPEYFEHDFGFVYRGLLHEARGYVEDGEIVVERKCDHLDLGTISEIEKFTDELADWKEAVAEVREQWKYDHWSEFVCSMPKDINLREVYGRYCDSLEEIRNRCRRILKHLPEPTEADLHTANMRKGIDLHRQGKSWPDIAETLYGRRDEEPNCTKAIKAFAKKHKIKLATRRPGRRAGK